MTKIILKHESAFSGVPAFDWLVSIDVLDREKEFINYLKENLYQIECEIVKKYQKENKGLRYIGSEDLLHISSINQGVLDLIKESIENGFEIIEVRI